MKYLKDYKLFESVDNTQMLDDSLWIKEQFSDYKEIYDFFNHIEKVFYGKGVHSEVGFGFFNKGNQMSTHQPIFKEIAIHLIKNDFNVDISELEKSYKTLLFSNQIHKFRKYMEQNPTSKWYYYQTIKKYMFDDNKYTLEEKMDYIKSYYNDNENINSKYDIKINCPVSFINVDLEEKS